MEKEKSQISIITNFYTSFRIQKCIPCLFVCLVCRYNEDYDILCTVSCAATHAVTNDSVTWNEVGAGKKDGFDAV